MSPRHLIASGGVVVMLLGAIVLALTFIDRNSIGYAGGVEGLAFWYAVGAVVLGVGAMLFYLGLRRQTVSGALCQHCGYDLRGHVEGVRGEPPATSRSTVRCPECGHDAAPAR